MKTARYLWPAICILLAAAGCKTGPDAEEAKTDERKQDVMAARDSTNEKMQALEDLFEVTWDNIHIQDDAFSRAVVGAQAEDDMIYVVASDGVIFFVNGRDGNSQSFYDAGAEPVILPMTRGEFDEEEFLYFSTRKDVYALKAPATHRGAIRTVWRVRAEGTIITPLCSTRAGIFFGCADNRIYDIRKASAATLLMSRVIWHLDGNITVPPVTAADSDHPFFVDDRGNLHRYTGIIDSEQRPVRTDVGAPAVPVVIDEQTETLLIASDNYKLTALNSTTGAAIKWTAQTKGIPTGELFVHTSAVYVLNDENELRAFHLDTIKGEHTAGEGLWNEKPVEEVERVIGPSKDGNVYLILTGERLAKLNVQSGEIIFTRPLPDVDFVLSNRAAGTLYFAKKEGWLWALRER